MIPTPQDPERFSFWVMLFISKTHNYCHIFTCVKLLLNDFSWPQLATLTDRRPSERLELLRLQDTEEVLEYRLV